MRPFDNDDCLSQKSSHSTTSSQSKLQFKNNLNKEVIFEVEIAPKADAKIDTKDIL
jgi:hypothetical protein